MAASTTSASLRAALANLASRHPAGRRHDHHAGRPQLLPDPGEDHHPQAARGAARLEDRGQPHQGRDPRALRQPDLPRPARLRLRRGVADLLRQAAEGRHGRPRRRCWPACPRRRRRSTRSPTRSGPRRASCTCCAGCTTLRFITDAQFKEAQTAPLAVRQGVRETLPTHAEFVAEMARQVVFDAYGEDAYTRGLTVWTTIRKADQEAAYAAVRRGVLDYDRRHGYRGPGGLREPAGRPRPRPRRRSSACSRRRRTATDLPPAVVLEATPDRGQGGAGQRRRRSSVTGDGLQFVARIARRQGAARARGIRRGAVIRLARDDKGRWAIAQLPQAEAAFVAIDAARRRHPRAGRRLRLRPQQVQPRDAGAAPARLVRSSRSSTRPRWRRASRRRPSSTTRRSSSPPTRPAARTGSPRTTTASSTARCACARRSRKSKNLVTVRVLQAIGPQYAQDYITRFGFDPKLHPAVPDDGARRRRRDAAADGRRLRGVRQRRLPRRART